MVKTVLALIVIVLLLNPSVGLAQKPVDQIYKKDGTSVAAKVLEITPTEIKYKKASNPDGPTYTILKGDATKIIYANGEVETYTDSPATTQPAVAKAETPFGADNFVLFSNDGRNIITDLTFPDDKMYLCLWTYDSKLRKKIKYDNRHENLGVCNWQLVADDGSYLQDASLYDNSNSLVTHFVNPETKQPFGNDAGGNIISPDGNRILMKTKGSKGYIYLFDRKGALLKTIKNESWTGIGAWRFSHNSSYFLHSGGKGLSKKGIISVFDKDGRPVNEIILETGYEDLKYYPYNKYGEAGNKGFVDFSFDDQWIIAPYSEEAVNIWDLKGTLIKSFPHFKPKVAAISPDGKMAVTVGELPYGHEETVEGKTYSGGQIKVWNMDGTLVKEIPFPTHPGSVTFTPDNSGIVVTVEGGPIWLWASEGYQLPEGYDKALVDLAKLQEQSRAAQRASEKRARNANMWGGFAKGFVAGMSRYNQEMGASNRRTAAQEKFINSTVNSALTDCHYVVFSKVIGGDLAISNIFKITRGCELNPSGCQVKFGDTYEELDKWIKATVAAEDKKANGRAVVSLDEWNEHFKNQKLAAQGGCGCK